MKRRKLIGVPVDLRWAFKRHHEVLAGIRRYASLKPDWELVVDPSADWFTHGDRQSFAGVVGRLPAPIAAAAKRSGIPAVDTTFRAKTPGVVFVRTDLHEVGRTAARHLLDVGHRQFAFCGSSKSHAHQVMLRAFKQVIEDAGCKVNGSISSDVEHYGGFGTRSPFGRWLASLKPPVSVLCTFDHVSRLIANEFVRRGAHVPEDVAVLGVGNEELVCEAMEPTLSSIDLNCEEVGYRAASVLDGILQGREASSELVPAVGVTTRRSTDIRVVPDVDVAAVLAAIHRDFRKPIGLPELLDHAGGSRRNVLRRFVAIVGRPIYQELMRRRIDEAKALLLRTTWSLNAIAAQSGFRDDKHLCRVFAAKVALTPAAWRSHYRRENAGARTVAGIMN